MRFIGALALAALAVPARAGMIIPYDLSSNPVVVPEPSSLLLLGVGLIAVGLLMRYHRNRTLK